ncbi:hypothetical protein PG997_009239 [Apiospora hydei]|uniref:Uncharacterized protein n=1 Tax=Apiospora hydei TaxID=1337664 RepID=A0ABR1VTK4_9PEZI
MYGYPYQGAGHTNAFVDPYAHQGSAYEFVFNSAPSHPDYGWPRQYNGYAGQPVVRYNPQRYEGSLESRGVPQFPSVYPGIW